MKRQYEEWEFLAEDCSRSEIDKLIPRLTRREVSRRLRLLCIKRGGRAKRKARVER
jgi:hypothetical protein